MQLSGKSGMLTYMLWTALYAAFVVAAFLLRWYMLENGLSEIWGWDYRTFVGQIQDWKWIGYFGFRHPGLGVVMSPLVALEHLWDGAYLLVMPGVALVTAWLIWKMSGWIGLAVWLTFPTTWLMAGTPESFPIAQLCLVASAYAMHCRPVAPVCAAVCAAVNGMVTITNGVKPLVAWLVGLRGRKLLLAAGGIVAVAFVAAGFFYIRSLITGRGVGAGVAMTLSWIPEHRDLPSELYGFFVRPVGVWQSFIVYPLVIWCVCKDVARHTFHLAPALLSFFAVDVSIHLVIGWGMSEPWVFAPHWVWMLPLVIGAICRRDTAL